MDTPYPSHVLNLVYATDKGYLFISAVSAASAARLAGPKAKDLIVHLLDCGLSDADWELFCTLVRKGSPQVQLKRHLIDTHNYARLVGYRNSLAVYARMRIPDLLPNADWCIYADGDSLFTEDPFNLLSLCDSNSAVLGWEVFDGTKEDSRSQNARRLSDWYAEHCPDFQVRHYICTGFLLINLVNWRKHNIPSQCLTFIERHAPPWPVDLSTNFVCNDCKTVLPREWGIFSEQITEISYPKFIHYVVDLPTKMRFRWRDGFRDVTAVWVNFARVVLGMSVRESCGIPRWKWMLGRAYNHALRVAVAVIGRTPFGRRWSRMKEFQSLFIPRKTRRWLLSRRLWTERWHGE